MNTYPDLLHFLRTATATQGVMQRPFLVAVDGYAGAGKSSLTKRLIHDLPQVQSITLDDFYRPLGADQQATLHKYQAMQAYFDTQTFCQQVLAPLHQQQAVTWQPFDWLTQQYLPAKQLHPHGVVVIEGVFASHDDLMAYMDTSVMVTAPAALRAQRVLQRPQETADWWPHWQATENWFHTQQKTHTRVAWIIDATVPV